MWLDDTQLLVTWERGFGKLPFERAIVMLAAALPEASYDQLMQLSIGRRDATLLKLRRQLFGERMETLVDCLECGATMEVAMSVGQIMLEQAPDPSTFIVDADGLEVEFRLPNSLDLARLQNCEPSQRREQLLAACITSVRPDGKIAAPSMITSTIEDKVTDAIAENDPQADIQLDVTCVACGHSFRSPLDIALFLWAELNAWAQRLLAEIHTLAKAYGWSERDILGLNRWRRQVYLNMVRQ